MNLTCSYIIPVPVIKHFVDGVEARGNYSGFCSLGLSCQPTENIQLREYFRMRPDLSGVLVSKINPLSNAYDVLKKDDIVLAFDGVLIANDGTGEFHFSITYLCHSHIGSLSKTLKKFYYITDEI